jgi:hypothetical protein
MNISNILNNPDILDSNKKWMLTMYNEIVIYDGILAQYLLGSKDLTQYDFVANLQLISRNHISIKSVSDYFKNSPLLLDGFPHFKTRLEYSRFYTQIESRLKNVLPKLSDTFFKDITDREDALFFVDNYINLTFRKTIALELNCNLEVIPEIPQSNSVFKFVPTLNELQKFNSNLEYLYKFISERIGSKNAWLLLSIIIMGESIRSVLLFSLIHFKKNYTDDISKLFDEVSAISIIPRKALSLIVIDDLVIKENQSVFISPFLIRYVNEKNQKIPQKNSLAFGYGVHSCPGKSIAKMICHSFLKSYVKYGEYFSINLSDGCFYRDFSLKIK